MIRSPGVNLPRSMPTPPAVECGASVDGTADTVTAVGIGVLVSGTGSNLQAILDASLPVTVVVADRVCGALDLAAPRGIPTAVVERGPDRVDFTHRIVDAL